MASRTPHAKRVAVDDNGLSLTTVKIRAGLPNLRRRKSHLTIEECFRKARSRFGCRLVGFSIMSNHLHLLVHAPDAAALSRWMMGINIRVAKALNKIWGRKGKVFLDRFHSTFAKHWSNVRRLVNYALNNARKHGLAIPKGEVDKFSSAAWYPHWTEGPQPKRPARECPVVSRVGVTLPRLPIDWRPGRPYGCS
ncbi:MAG: hypothetical protein HKM96_04955 [Boseongicola sp.]|nr:hypothetical protein [Boseongicola sp.]